MSVVSRQTKTLLRLLLHHHIRPFSSPPPPPQTQHLTIINQLSRILSDYRHPQNDIIPPLTPFTHSITPDIIEQVLKRCHHLPFSAHSLFTWAHSLPSFTPTHNTHNILLDILGKNKQFPLVWDLLNNLKNCQGEGQGQISNFTFWAVFSNYARANLPLDAIRAFKNMECYGVEPGVEDFDRLLYVLCKRRHVREAQVFFDEFKVKFSPSVKTYSILVRGWGFVGESGEARKVFDEMVMRGLSVDVHAFNSVLESLCKGGEVDEARELFREMRGKGLEPDAFSYSIFVHAACEADDVHSAFRVLDRMKRYGLVPNVFTYNAIINRLCKNDKVEEAYELLDEMIERNVKPDVWSYNAVLSFHCNRLEVNMATKLVSRMDVDACDPDRHTYNMLLKMLIRVGRFDRVTSVWNKMIDKGFHPSASTYAVMVHGLCPKKGKLEDACHYFEMMVDDGIPPYSATCELLRNKIIGLGFAEQVEILADKMERSTSCTIQDLSSVMRGNRKNIKTSKEEASSEESDY